jgi:hypothetical protein
MQKDLFCNIRETKHDGGLIKISCTIYKLIDSFLIGLLRCNTLTKLQQYPNIQIITISIRYT